MLRSLAVLTVLLAALGAVAWSAARPSAEEETEGASLPRGPFSEDEVAEIKQFALDEINGDRADEGLQPVEFDELANEAADLFAAEALENETIGHFTLDGLSPFDRWGLAGGVDFVAENVCAWEWTGSARNWTKSEVVEILDDFQEAMVNETPPNNGHRLTILNPRHTHVGVGLALNGTQIRFVHEFVSRYVSLTRELPAEARRGDAIEAHGRILDPARYRLDFLLLYHAREPRELTRAECASRHTYSLPNDVLVLRPFLPESQYYVSDRKSGEVTVDERQGTFSARLPWFKGTGWYYVAALLAPKDARPGEGQFPATFPWCA